MKYFVRSKKLQQPTSPQKNPKRKENKQTKPNNIKSNNSKTPNQTNKNCKQTPRSQKQSGNRNASNTVIVKEILCLSNIEQEGDNVTMFKIDGIKNVLKNTNWLTKLYERDHHRNSVLAETGKKLLLV